MNQNQVQKPISIQRTETTENLVEVINNCGLPAFILEPIVKDIYEQVKSLAILEYQKDKEEYEKLLLKEDAADNS